MKMHRVNAVVCAALAGSTASVADAQTAWINPINGAWSVATNWSGGVPSLTLDATIGHSSAYTVSSAIAVRDLTISNSLAQLTVASGSSFSVAGNVINAGTITINPTAGSNNANMVMGAAASSITGTGTIVLNGVGSSINDANLSAPTVNEVMTHGAGHTITGMGQVHLTMINNGLVVADGAGRYIQLLTGAKTNNALFLAQNGATLDLENVVVNQTGGGTFRATGTNSIGEAHGSIIGGVVEGVSGGIIRNGGALTLDGVDLNGIFQVQSGSTVSVQSSLTNTGTITVNPTGGSNDANLSFVSPAITLDGNGSIVLNGSTSFLDANIIGFTVTDVLTQSAGHTITGIGRVVVGLVNNGLVSADGPGKFIQLSTTAKTNNALMVAQNGAGIDVEGVVLTQTGGGTYRAIGAGSTAEVHGSIIGGTVEGLSGGIVRTGGALTLDGVDLNGAFHVQSGHTVSVLSSLTNTGVLTVNPSGGSTDANLTFSSPAVTLDGAGTIALNGVASFLDANIYGQVGTEVLTQSAGHTITGSGRVGVNLVNNGLVQADGAGKTIQLALTPKANSAIMVAQNGALIDVDGIVLTQTGGTYRATGAGSIAEAHGSIIGGVVEGVSGGVVRTGGALLLDNVDLNGKFEVISGHTVSVQNSLTNTGTIVVNPTAGANDAVLAFASPTLAVDGGGEVVLNAVGSTSDARLAFSAATNVLTNGPGHTIAGNGQIGLTTTNQGILSPGHALNGDLTQRIELSGAQGDVTCAASSVVRIDIAGAAAGQFDSITGGTGTSFICGGTLDVTHIKGFSGPPVNTIIDIIVAPSVTGTFSTVNTPPLPNDGRYILLYLPDRVRLIATCYVNCDSSTGSPLLTSNDFQCFLNQFAAGTTYANCDHSTGTPTLTSNDFQCFLNRYAAGCF